MKTLAGILLGFVLVISSVAGYSQTTRRADTAYKFFIAALEPFDRWPKSHSAPDPDTLWGPLGTVNRYVNLFTQDSELRLTGEWRSIWDVPTDTIPTYNAIGGQSAPLLNTIILDPVVIHGVLQNALQLRFETERHQPTGNDTSEYAGFQWHAGLRGKNINDAAATSPGFLLGTSQSANHDTNAIQLKVNIDSAGVFCDTFWTTHFFRPVPGSPLILWAEYTNGFDTSKLMIRFRVRVDSLIDTTGHNFPNLFSVTIRQDSLSGLSQTVLSDTVKVDGQFHHMGSAFDTISMRVKFRGGNYNIYTGITLNWMGTVPMTMDYLELISTNYDSLHGNYDDYNNYDTLTKNQDTVLKLLINNLVNKYKGKAQYIMTQEEFPLSEALIFKRAVKILRDLSGGQMEFITLLHDSADAGGNPLYTSYYGKGTPNGFLYTAEGVHRGWLDSSLYADPKMFIVGVYPWTGSQDPLPKRDVSTGSAYRTWELTHAVTGVNCDTTLDCAAYSRPFYLYRAQSILNFALYQSRQAKRACLRDSAIGQRFIEAVMAGDGVATQVTNCPADTVGGVITPAHTNKKIFYGPGGLRAITGPELKEECHLAISCGASGLILYQLQNDTPWSLNGGLMNWDGSHTEMLHTFTIGISSTDTLTRTMYMGWKENYDTAKILFPIIQKYGSALVNAHYFGDWTAAELPLSPMKNSLPFTDSSIASFDDSLHEDVFKIDSTDGAVDTTNRTLVHISMWLDNDSTQKALHQDTMLYITNMRTDDSYDTTAVPTTIDRRLITMQFKAKHLVQDINDSTGYLALDNRKIWTPYVGAGDSLRLLLLAGDGILVRLLPGPDSMKQMRASISYPKGGKDFNNYGRIKFDKPVKGVLDPTTSSKYSIPSSPYSYIGIRDIDTVKLWQDSLLYIKIDTVDKSRKGFWRNQNWTNGNGGIGNVQFNFRKILPASSTRQKQISTDSIAHNIVIKTDLEEFYQNGKIAIRDPFLVDSATLLNVYDTLAKTSPFLPQFLSAGRMPGADSQHYGGVFLKQNIQHDTTTPIYTLKGYNMLKAGTYAASDSAPYYVDWVFLNWAAKDTIVAGDLMPWLSNSVNEATYGLWNFNKKPQVVFGKDSAIYVARYKCHLGSFNSGLDSGLSWNNQRKLYYVGLDGSGHRWYRMVYASNGRIFTVTGYRNGPNNNNINWGNEQLVSLWDNSQAAYPALGGHRTPTDTSFLYIFQDNSSGQEDIKLTKIDTNGIPFFYPNLDTGTTDIGASDATPVIYGVQAQSGLTIDVAAWASNGGIKVKAMYAIDSSVINHNETSNEYTFGTSTARHPTIWVDSVNYGGNSDSSRYAVTLAWQQDTTMHEIRNPLNATDSTYTDIFCVRFDVMKSKLYPYFYLTTHAGENALHPKDVSHDLWHSSWDNRNPCISGARYDSVTSLIRIAYETMAYDSGHTSQGISVVQRRDGVGWGFTTFFPTLDTVNDRFTKPSIEVSRYHDSSGTNVKEQTYYSLTYERADGQNIEHWAMNNITNRIAPNIFLYISNPQLAVVRESIDSDTYRMGLSLASPGAPHWLVSGYTALYKVAGNDTLWGYSFIEEPDSTNTFHVGYGMGEYAIDNGTTKADLEIRDRPDSEVIDGNHLAGYFSQSENFTLPASGTFSYYRWITVTDPAQYKKKLDTIMYALDFFDTAGTFVCRLDSIYLCDSVTYIKRATSSITISRDSSVYGYVKMRRITSGLPTDGSTWEPIITLGRLSSQASNKQTAKPYSMLPDDILFTAEPNPTHGDMTLTFGIPFEGPVSIDAYDQLGNKAASIENSRLFHAGEQSIIWHPGSLPSGVYYLQLRYSNLQKVVRVIYLR